VYGGEGRGLGIGSVLDRGVVYMRLGVFVDIGVVDSLVKYGKLLYGTQ
jgi:hypothetical protein